jgi:hypothetical protein
MRLPLGLDRFADFVVDAAVEIDRQPDAGQQRSQQAPFERKPAGVDQLLDDGETSMSREVVGCQLSANRRFSIGQTRSTRTAAASGIIAIIAGSR